jgi:hypothetical protein
MAGKTSRDFHDSDLNNRGFKEARRMQFKQMT